jgi:hypothetical protein
MRRVVILALAGLLAACGQAESEYSEEGEIGERLSAENEGFSEERGGESYEEFDERRDSYEESRGSFAGYGCTVDCSGHEAGYQWAEDNGITDPDQCGGNSWSFEEGCRAYAEENGY